MTAKTKVTPPLKQGPNGRRVTIRHPLMGDTYDRMRALGWAQEAFMFTCLVGWGRIGEADLQFMREAIAKAEKTRATEGDLAP